MLPADSALASQGVDAVRFATPDSLEGYSAGGIQLNPVASRVSQLQASRTLVDAQAALEESFFLGLRLNRGISLDELRSKFGCEVVDRYRPIIAELIEDGLLENVGGRRCLTARGRLLSNEVFAHFLQDKSGHRRDAAAQR